MLQISDVDLCLSPAGAVGKKNLSSETYVKEDDCDTANMEDFGLKIPIIIETLEMDNGKTVSSIGSSNLVVSCAHFYQTCLKLNSKIIISMTINLMNVFTSEVLRYSQIHFI